jgi:hypothetical protein
MKKICAEILKRHYLIMILIIDIFMFNLFVKYQYDIFFIKWIGYGIDPALSTIITVPAINGIIAGFSEKDRNSAIILGAILGGIPILYWIFWSHGTNTDPAQLFRGWFYHVLFTQICAGFFFSFIAYNVNVFRKNLITRFESSN